MLNDKQNTVRLDEIPEEDVFIDNQCLLSTSTAKEIPTSGFCLRYEGDQIV
jgi:hypothetical protein